MRALGQNQNKMEKLPLIIKIFLMVFLIFVSKFSSVKKQNDNSN